MNVDPSRRRGPRGPHRRVEQLTRGHGGPPLAASGIPARNIDHAVAVEIPHLYVDPSGRGAPDRPQAGREGRAGGLADPPLAALKNPAGDVTLAVAIEVTHLDV